MRLPKEVRPVSSQELIVAIVLAGLRKGWVARTHGEEDDTKGEQVDDLALVWLLHEDFGGHISRRADLRAIDARAIAALERACEAEVDNLDIVVFVKEDILWLEVTMREST